MSPPVRSVASDETLPSRVDVVIIGGGIAGVATAYMLVRQGSSVALVEKGVIAGEQSSRNWGWCRQQNRDPREIPLIKLSLEIWGKLAEEVGKDLGFRRTGLVYGTRKQSDLDAWENWARIAAEHGIESRVLSDKETAEKLAGNSRTWLGGVFSPTDGSAEPDRAVPILAAAARRHGASLHQHCAARALDVSAGRISGVVTERGLIRASSVLVAGGAWSGMFLRHHGIKFLQASVKSTSFYTEAAPCVTEGGISMEDITFRRRLDGGYTVGLSGRGELQITPLGLMQARPFWATFKKRRNGLTYSIGRSFFDGPEALTHWSADGVSPFEKIRMLDPMPDEPLVKRGVEELVASYPALAGIKVAQKWGGIVDATPDAIPTISPIAKLPGLFVSAGYSGHGFGIGPAAGRLAADLIRGDTPCVDPHPFRYERMIDGTDLGAPGMM